MEIADQTHGVKAAVKLTMRLDERGDRPVQKNWDGLLKKKMEIPTWLSRTESQGSVSE
jgi:hypothetical protein